MARALRSPDTPTQNTMDTQEKTTMCGRCFGVVNIQFLDCDCCFVYVMKDLTPWNECLKCKVLFAPWQSCECGACPDVLDETYGEPSD